MAGYSGTPLAKKLGILEDSRVCVLAAPAGYRPLLDPLPPGVVFARHVDARTDLVHCFSMRKADLEAALARLRTQIAPHAAIWVSWPKKAAKIPTDITEDTIRAIAIPLGFVDVKVCAVDETWSGLKLVVRKALR